MTCHRHIQHPRDSVTAPGLSRPHGCGRGDPWGARRSLDRTPLPRVNQHQNFVLPANYRGSFPADPPGDGDESGETLAEFHLQDVLSCSVLACPRTFLLLLCPYPILPSNASPQRPARLRAGAVSSEGTVAIVSVLPPAPRTVVCGCLSAGNMGLPKGLDAGSRDGFMGTSSTPQWADG